MNALVLIAEADPFNLRLLQEVCEAAGHDVVSANDTATTLSVIARRSPDLLVLDMSLPGEFGGGQGALDVLRMLKDDGELSAIPVIVTTHGDDVESRREAITLGAEDYVARPYRVFEIQQRVRNALRRVIAERRLLALEGDELLDPLTRTGSASQLQVSLEYEMTRATRYSHELTCVSVQVVGLDQLIAERGRDAGDGLLVQLASGLRTCVRAIDHLFRAARDEFVLVLPETSPATAHPVLTRIAERGRELSNARLAVGIAGRIQVAAHDGPALLEAARAVRADVRESAW